MSNANDRQVGGQHYGPGNALQHWDIVEQFNLDYFQGNITKYVFRWRKKDGIKDLKKAAHYLQKYIEIEEAKEQADHAAAIRSEQDDAIRPSIGGASQKGVEVEHHSDCPCPRCWPLGYDERGIPKR